MLNTNIDTDIETIYNYLCNKQSDIHEHLPTLRKYASKVKNITEMGTRFGVSTYAFLIGKPKKLISYDINYKFFMPYENDIIKYAEKCNTEFEFREADVLEADIENTELLFIDTLHTYNQLSKELRKHESKVDKWIILHDTITFGYIDERYYDNGTVSNQITDMKIKETGLMNALIHFLIENNNWKIKEHFTNNNGLTVLERIRK